MNDFSRRQWLLLGKVDFELYVLLREMIMAVYFTVHFTPSEACDWFLSFSGLYILLPGRGTPPPQGYPFLPAKWIGAA